VLSVRDQGKILEDALAGIVQVLLQISSDDDNTVINFGRWLSSDRWLFLFMEILELCSQSCGQGTATRKRSCSAWKAGGEPWFEHFPH